MSEAKLNSPFDIPIGEIEERIKSKLNGDTRDYGNVVSLRAIERVEDVSVFSDESFISLIKNIPLRGTDFLPYHDSDIRVFSLDPTALLIGQRFVLKSKLTDIVENFGKGRGILSGFCLPGFSILPPLRIYGRDRDERKVIGFYSPPLVERHGSEDNYAAILDGIHRCSITAAAGSTNNVVYIKRVGARLPFKPITWKETKYVAEKPPIDERYFNLDKSLFRDLGAVGIDG